MLITTGPTTYYRSPGEGARDTLPAGTIFEPASSDGSWVQISPLDPNPWGGKWILAAYTKEYVDEPEPPTEPPSSPDVVHIIEVHIDGKIAIDGGDPF